MKPTLTSTNLKRPPTGQNTSGAGKALYLLLAGGRPVVRSDAERTETEIIWLEAHELISLGADPAEAIVLGSDPLDGTCRHALSLAETAAAEHKQRLGPAIDLKSLAAGGTMAARDVSLLGLAKSLIDWHAGHRFCGACGTPTVISDGGWKRVCPACQRAAFPRVDPVVIMLVSDGARALLARQPHFPERMWSLIAGFVEPGEDIEAAVVRETLEETGLAVTEVQYALSQPWPFPHSLMIGCIARAAASTLNPDSLELEDARWFTRDELSAMIAGGHREGLWVPGRQAIAHSLIGLWLEASACP